MKFSELKCCPFCDSEEYYTTSKVSGTVSFKERFDGKEADNEDMYNSLNHITNKRVYCAECEKYLGDCFSDTVSKTAEKEIKRKNRITTK